MDRKAGVGGIVTVRVGWSLSFPEAEDGEYLLMHDTDSCSIADRGKRNIRWQSTRHDLKKEEARASAKREWFVMTEHFLALSFDSTCPWPRDFISCALPR